MTFKHKLLPQLELEEVTTPQGRYYKTLDGFYLPSVTTVLGRMLDKSGIKAWEERIGKEEAKKVKRIATTRGSLIHSAAENFILNRPGYDADLMMAENHMFQQLKPILERSVGMVMGVENPLYSKALYTAGRTDLIAEWDGTPSIIDYKTCKFEKKEEHTKSYFLQATIYAYMASTLYSIKIPQIVIVIVPVHENPVVIKKDVRDYFGEAREIFFSHKEKYLK